MVTTKPKSPEEEAAHLASSFGWSSIPAADLQDYTAIISRAHSAFAAISALDDYQPTPDLSLSPRTNVHLPPHGDPASNPLGAWAYRCECRQSDIRSSSSSSSSPLAGRTVCLKDNIALAGVPCLLGTSTLSGPEPWTPTTDATVVTRLLSAGAVVSGKAVCENLSRGAVSNTAATGPVDNPYAKGYSAGGSSSGTAALVGSGAAELGIGCDQGGSIRIPAALCGLYGMKGTVGLVPYTGIASNDASVDYVGPITRTAMDCAEVLGVVAGVDGVDDRQGAGTPFPGQVPDYAGLLRGMGLDGNSEKKGEWLKGVKMGILKEGLTPSTMDPGVRDKFLAAVDVFKTLGVEVTEVSVSMHTNARTIYTVMSKMGNHMGMLGRATGRKGLMLTDLLEKKALPYTDDVVARMNTTSRDGLLAGELGWQQYPLAYPKSVNLMRQVRDLYDAALRDVDFLVMPTCVTPANRYPDPAAPPLEQAAATSGKLENTCSFNGTGHPALAMPIGLVPAMDDGKLMLPASLQIVGRFWDEANMLKAAYAWEKAQDWREL